MIFRNLFCPSSTGIGDSLIFVDWKQSRKPYIQIDKGLDQLDSGLDQILKKFGFQVLKFKMVYTNLFNFWQSKSKLLKFKLQKVELSACKNQKSGS